jgi:hypothetical protein
MNRREEIIKLTQEDSALYQEIRAYLATHIHPATPFHPKFSQPFTLEKLVPPNEGDPLTYFIGLCLEGNPIHHSTVNKEWYDDLKKIGRYHSVFLNLPIKYSHSV